MSEPSRVELTRVHYYGTIPSRHKVPIFSISRNLDAHATGLTAKNNSISKHKFSARKRSAYALAFAFLVATVTCLAIAACFDLPLFLAQSSNTILSAATVDTYDLKQRALSVLKALQPVQLDDTKSNTTFDGPSQNTTTTRITDNQLCVTCDFSREICLNVNETASCLKIKDKKDPTGCGGLCEINRQYCKLLDKRTRLFQCKSFQNALLCSRDSFNCGNMCLSSKMRCDGIVHCANGLDEANCECDVKTHFKCNDSVGCMEMVKVCDGQVDCRDGSDEFNCALICARGYISCYSGQCIPENNFCDGKYHCSDKSDEPQGCVSE